MTEVPEDPTKRGLVPVARLNLDTEPDLVHLSVLKWIPACEAWATGMTLCGRSASQGALPDGTLVTCQDCEGYRDSYERALSGRPTAEQEEIAELKAQLADMVDAKASSYSMTMFAKIVAQKHQALAERKACLAETNRAREAEQAALRRVAELENVITWDTTCGNCAKLLDASYTETVRAEKAEALVQRVREVTPPKPAAGWQATYYDGWGDALAAVTDALDVRDWEEVAQ